MSDNDLKRYPRGKIGLGAGDLQTCTGAKYSFTNGAKLKHTLRNSPSGIVMGLNEVSGSLDFIIDEDGYEKSIIDMVKTGKPQQFRFKDPTDTETIEGTITTVDKEYPLDDAIAVSVSFVGKLLD